jgi:acyl-CoA thioester hydrolase
MKIRKFVQYFPPDEKAPLTFECFRRVQFDEVDSLRIVWCGRYVSYLEQGRNEWGRKFGFGYQDMVENGFVMPIVQLHIDHFHPLQYDELIRIKTSCHWTEAAKMNISYEIYAENGTLSARGYTVQVYTDLTGKPMILKPEFAEQFFQKWDEWSSQNESRAKAT